MCDYDRLCFADSWAQDAHWEAEQAKEAAAAAVRAVAAATGRLPTALSRMGFPKAVGASSSSGRAQPSDAGLQGAQGGR